MVIEIFGEDYNFKTVNSKLILKIEILRKKMAKRLDF
jgi:hypothetical protein